MFVGIKTFTSIAVSQINWENWNENEFEQEHHVLKNKLEEPNPYFLIRQLAILIKLLNVD